MEAAHGVPVAGEWVFVVISLVFFNVKFVFEAPVVPGSEVAALVNVAAVEGGGWKARRDGRFW